MTAPVERGVCRHCGCREGAPCSLCRAEHGDCAWLTSERVVCAGSPCVRAEAQRKDRKRKPKPVSRFAHMGYGAICRIKRRESEQARKARRKGRAA